jgi:hypothetical protein
MFRHIESSILHRPFDYGKPMEQCSRAEVQAFWDARADEAERIAVQFLKQFRLVHVMDLERMVLALYAIAYS